MLRPIAGVGEGFGAARVLAGVRLLSRVAPKVRLQVLQAGVRLAAAFELEMGDWIKICTRATNIGRKMDSVSRGALEMSFGMTVIINVPCLKSQKRNERDT